MSTPTEDQASKDQSPAPISSDEKLPNNTSVAVDSELDAILDSALADFDKPNEAKQSPLEGASASVGATSEKDGKSQGKQEGGDLEGDNLLPEELNYDFLSDAMTKQFEDCFSSLLKDPAVKKQFEDLSKSAEEAATSNNPSAFAETVEKALSGMSLNAENLQAETNQQQMWEQLAESFANEGAAPGTAEEAGGIPSMEGLGAMGGMFQAMVQQLLSKELLYQPLKEVTQKYHDYLTKNKEVLDTDTSTKYRKQLEVIEKVVEHLEGETDDQSQDEKNARFEVLLDLLQKMHELGNPPKEVVGEGNMMMPNLPDLANLGSFPGMAGGPDPSQCSLM